MDAPHDPGGKVRWALPEGMRGDAALSPCGRYRMRLEREWTMPGETRRAIMFCGKNPSTADALVQDTTCGRETERARRMGYTRYLKGNVLDWRATNPKDLPKDPTEACSAENLPELMRMADQAECIVMVYGRLHPRYGEVVERVVGALRATGKPMWCFGRNQDGSAKHPLFLRKDAPLEPF